MAVVRHREAKEPAWGQVRYFSRELAVDLNALERDVEPAGFVAQSVNGVGAKIQHDLLDLRGVRADHASFELGRNGDGGRCRGPDESQRFINRLREVDRNEFGRTAPR